MDTGQLKKANIYNLTCLWKKMGTQPRPAGPGKNLHTSVSWPYRCWLDWEADTVEISEAAIIFSRLQNNNIVPVWGGLGGGAAVLERMLIDNGFELLFEQTAMYLCLEGHEIIGRPRPDIAIITSERDIETWTDIAARSFEYEIDAGVIRKTADDPAVQLLLALVDGRPAATAMLFRTGDITGVHQLGVQAQYRGRGVARTLMQYVIGQCIESAGKYITLQASSAGLDLYGSLGFRRQFTIRNYQRTMDNDI